MKKVNIWITPLPRIKQTLLTILNNAANSHYIERNTTDHTITPHHTTTSFTLGLTSQSSSHHSSVTLELCYPVSSAAVIPIPTRPYQRIIHFRLEGLDLLALSLPHSEPFIFTDLPHNLPHTHSAQHYSMTFFFTTQTSSI